MEILTTSDLAWETRNHTLVKYEGFIRDEKEFLSDLTYRRAFEREFRERLDGIIEKGDAIVIRDAERIPDDADYRSAWLMTAQAQRCFPDMFITSKELKGMDVDARHRLLVERKFSNCARKMDKWTKYKKGKGKK